MTHEEKEIELFCHLADLASRRSLDNTCNDIDYDFSDWSQDELDKTAKYLEKWNGSLEEFEEGWGVDNYPDFMVFAGLLAKVKVYSFKYIDLLN